MSPIRPCAPFGRRLSVWSEHGTLPGGNAPTYVVAIVAERCGPALVDSGALLLRAVELEHDLGDQRRSLAPPRAARRAAPVADADVLVGAPVGGRRNALDRLDREHPALGSGHGLSRGARRLHGLDGRAAAGAVGAETAIALEAADGVLRGAVVAAGHLHRAVAQLA